MTLHALNARALRAGFAAAILSAGWAGAADAASILSYGPSAGREDLMAEHLGHTVTTADAATWTAMTAEQFAEYDVIAFGDAYCTGSKAHWNAANVTRERWSAAVIGNIAIVTVDIGMHYGLGPPGDAGHQLLGQILDFAAGGDGTGLYFSTGCSAAFDAPGTALTVLEAVGGFRTTGQFADGACRTGDVHDPLHPEDAALTNADSACARHGALSMIPPGYEFTDKAGLARVLGRTQWRPDAISMIASRSF